MALVARAFATDANLDPTFGTYGATVVNQAIGAGTTDRGEDVALQADGKIVVAGTSGSGASRETYSSAVSRLLAASMRRSAPAGRS